MSDHREDRRVRRTKGLLRGAIASLVHEKPYDAIAVKEILSRANVGRSAFYAHFRDKEELLLSAVRETLRAAGSDTGPTADPAERVIRFGRPLLEHVERSPHAPSAARHAALHERVRQVLVELVADELRRASPRGGEGASDVPPDLLARHVADTFLLVLSWWVERGRPCSAAEADAVFRALVLPAVTAAVRARRPLAVRVPAW